jgi:methylmalonyl-CoA mutase N-terminal domain/subunit
MGVARYIKSEKDEITDVVLQSGIHVKPVYTPNDLEAVGFAYEKDTPDPGAYPLNRGIHPL